MARRKKLSFQKRKSTSKTNSTPGSPTRSTRGSVIHSSPTSSSMTRTPTQNTSKVKQLQKSKNSTVKKRKNHPVPMRIGNKVFLTSKKILKEIKHYQTTTFNLIPKLPFARLVQETILKYTPEGRRIQRLAIEALQEATENYLVQYFEDSYICSMHARRSTLIPRDMNVVERLRHNI